MNKSVLIALSITLSFSLVGCSSNKSKEKKLLPDSGPTTVELMRGTKVGNDYYGNFGNQGGTLYSGKDIAAGYSPNSTHTNEHVRELQRDFKRVPNPDIVGYVYPHINGNEMPVPGYFTIFKLYSRDHFALTEEGYHVQ